MFLVTAGASGLVFGFGALPGATTGSAATEAAAAFDPTIWYSIGTDGIVTVNVGKADMGQHIASTMAQVVADELGASWSHMRVNLVGNDPKFNDPVLGANITGGSWSTMMNFDLMSRVGAAGRIALTETGAAMLGVKKDDVVINDFSGRLEDDGQVGQLRGYREVRQGDEDVLARRPEGDRAEDGGSIHLDWPRTAAAGHSIQGERFCEIRHRHVPAGNGVRSRRYAAGALRRKGHRR